MKRLNVGIIGLGWVAGAHIEAFKSVQGAGVTAVCSRRQLDPLQLERDYGIAIKPYQSLEDMLQDPSVDIVDICTPHSLHAKQAVAAARAGKHLIIEKPIALNFHDALEIRSAIRKAGVSACVCFEVRFSRHATAIRSMLDQGLMGEIHFGEIDYYHGIGPWYGQFEWNVRKEFGGSSLLTAGCHALDLLLWYMGSPVEEVACYSTRSESPIFSSYEYDTASVTILKFQNGRVGKVASVIDCLQPYYFRIHLIGSEGSILDNRFHSDRLEGLDKNRWSSISAPPVDSGDVADHPYLPQFQAFVDSISKGNPMPLTDFDTAFETHRAAFAADLSAESGRPVRLAELEG
ncbi:MAG TPA: Gfo/Idh/MocA family oxidoreductase [Acidobacteriota bacterium]|nr:Gfo/Idh/MocA family oxidoreductase [Acidobacteriota bacterium]